MCPACIATVTLIVAGTTSAGAVSVPSMEGLRPKTGAKIVEPITQIGTDC